jgi:hypothetical protein
LKDALEKGGQYSKVYKGQNALDISMGRKSYESAKVMLEYIISSQSLYDKMSEAQIIRLIKFAPSNLKEFFDKSVKTAEDGMVP